jgi:hypothetical protein
MIIGGTGTLGRQIVTKTAWIRAINFTNIQISQNKKYIFYYYIDRRLNR